MSIREFCYGISVVILTVNSAVFAAATNNRSCADIYKDESGHARDILERSISVNPFPVWRLSRNCLDSFAALEEVGGLFYSDLIADGMQHDEVQSRVEKLLKKPCEQLTACIRECRGGTKSAAKGLLAETIASTVAEGIFPEYKNLYRVLGSLFHNFRKESEKGIDILLVHNDLFKPTNDYQMVEVPLIVIEVKSDSSKLTTNKGEIRQLSYTWISNYIENEYSKFSEAGSGDRSKVFGVEFSSLSSLVSHEIQVELAILFERIHNSLDKETHDEQLLLPSVFLCRCAIDENVDEVKFQQVSVYAAEQSEGSDLVVIKKSPSVAPRIPLEEWSIEPDDDYKLVDWGLVQIDGCRFHEVDAANCMRIKLFLKLLDRLTQRGAIDSVCDSEGLNLEDHPTMCLLNKVLWSFNGYLESM